MVPVAERGGVRHQMAQRDGRVGEVGVANRKGIVVAQVRIQRQHALLHQLQDAHGRNHLGNGGQAEIRLAVHGNVVRAVGAAILKCVDDAPVPDERDGRAHGVIVPQNALQRLLPLGVRLRVRAFAIVGRQRGGGQQHQHQQQSKQASHDGLLPYKKTT